MFTMYKKLADTIRVLSVDAIQNANSGHPGMPLGMADIATVLWKEFLSYNPCDPLWINRDRFVLSNGHGSMLLYSLLHLSGYNISIEDIKNFRKLHSKTPGHPEFGITPGVETTTGPLGQGLANAVGMALAEKLLAKQFNKPKFNIINHYTYAFVGDGCLMEGVSHEASSLAGTFGLGKLIVLWDNNSISIDGNTKNWFTDDTAKRFRAYNWYVIDNVDGHNYQDISRAIKKARSVSGRPSLICCKTIIGYGAPGVCNTHNCHGSPLGEEEIKALRQNLNWQYSPFVIPEEIYSAWSNKDHGEKIQRTWIKLFSKYAKYYPDLAHELIRRLNRQLPTNWKEKSSDYIYYTATNPVDIATRQASQKSLNAYGPLLPELLGGSADLTSSNLTNWNNSKDITSENLNGNYIHYGVREFGMFAIMNGLSLHGGFIPYGGTFLVFSSYGHNAIRMSAIMGIQVIYVFSHDSIGLGEDGPTHQPVEHLTMLRATPNVSLWRPCDETETAIAWQCAIDRKNGPTALVLSRQKLASQNRNDEVIQNIKKGGYILLDVPSSQLECILIATGSEVNLAMFAAKTLNKDKQHVRVVSMPSIDVFEQQDKEYKQKVLPANITKRIAIEAGSSCCWHRYIGQHGKVICLDRYGESASDKVLFNLFGFSLQNIIETTKL